MDTDKIIEKKVIVIDPGHGGYDPGAVWRDIYEKHINLSVAMLLKEYLEQEGFKVLLTRTGDYNHAVVGMRGKQAKRFDLDQRIKIAHDNNADLLLTIHVNSTRKSSYEGAEAFFHHKSVQGSILAQSIQRQFNSIPGITPRAAKTSDCYMLRNSSMTAVLVELGYLSNADERTYLTDPKYLDTLAQKITAGVVDYYASPESVSEMIVDDDQDINTHHCLNI